MPGTGVIPKHIGQGGGNIAEEGRRAGGIKQVLVSLLADLLEVQAKYGTHTHGGFAPPPAPPEQISIGTTEGQV